jgi:hypothetical protein
VARPPAPAAIPARRAAPTAPAALATAHATRKPTAVAPG